MTGYRGRLHVLPAESCCRRCLEVARALVVFGLILAIAPFFPELRARL